MNNTENDRVRMGQCSTLGLIADKIRLINSQRFGQKILSDLHHYIYLRSLMNGVILSNNFSQSGSSRADMIDLEIVGRAMLQAKMLETDGGSIVAGDINRCLQVIVDNIDKIIKTGELTQQQVSALEPFLLGMSDVSKQMYSEIVVNQSVVSDNEPSLV